MTYAEAAIKVLEKAGEPLHYKEITDRALVKGYCTTNAKTPDQSLYTAIAYQMGRGDKSDFVKVSPGVFGLREWKDSSSEIAESIEETEYKIRVPHYPPYEEVRRLLPVLEGVQASEFTGMRSEIFGLTGTPQDPMDWSDPDAWIAMRLTGTPQDIARRVWLESDKMVNPRHSHGHWLLARRYELVQIDADGSIKISQRGRDFIENVTGTAVVYLDEQEGVLELLSLIAASGPGSKADFIDDWGEYVRKVANYQSDSSIQNTFYDRTRNLLARGYIERSGYTYNISDAGLDYLGGAEELGGSEDGSIIQDVRELTNTARKFVREGLRELLEDIDPYDFEELVKRLLQKMGYTDLDVTSRGNDKGVDVLGDIELGITSVREVIQVKRNTTSNIHRPTLDQLRGSLHRFDAVRGTIITTSDFSSGTREAAFEKGAAPITLINGDKLIDLLIEHRLGVRSEKVEVLRLEPADFAVEGEEDEERLLASALTENTYCAATKDPRNR